MTTQDILKKLKNIKYIPSILGSNIVKRKFGKCGKNFLIEGSYDFLNTKKIFIGDNVYFNDHVRIIVHGKTTVKIGNFVMIGPYCYIFTKLHGFSRTDIPMRQQPDSFKSVEIGDDVWIGNNVTILPGVKIGSGSIIGSGAVVTKNVPAYSIVGGVPAKLIRNRKGK